MSPEFMRVGDLVQIRKGVHGRGEVGTIVGLRTFMNGGCFDVLFHDGIRSCHPSNLQKPDGRLRPLHEAR